MHDKSKIKLKIFLNNKKLKIKNNVGNGHHLTTEQNYLRHMKFKNTAIYLSKH
jgi:hypothetical protein